MESAGLAGVSSEAGLDGELLVGTLLLLVVAQAKADNVPLCWLPAVAVVAVVALAAAVVVAVVAAVVAASGGASRHAAGNGVLASGAGAIEWRCCCCSFCLWR